MPSRSNTPTSRVGSNAWMLWNLTFTSMPVVSIDSTSKHSVTACAARAAASGPAPASRS